MPEAPIRVIVADDHPIVLRGLQQLFESVAGFEVAALCRDGDEAIAAARREQADVLVLDLRMPGRSGLDVMRTVTAEKLPCRIVLLTATLRDAQVTEVVQLGARGLVLKESNPDTLIECVRRVRRGERWIDRAALTRVLDHAVRAAGGPLPGGSLTPRELEIVRMLAEGLRNKEIGEKLFITEGTVKLHLHHIYEKAGVDGRLELVLWAQQKGLV
jgi:DNA-binding NarL/FixJ family response regulator